MNREAINAAVDKYKDLILEAERYIWKHPETGYKELKTSAYLEEAFVRLGYDIVKAEGITGFYTVIDTGREGPELLILGELDSVICPSHKDADPVTGAVHSCGHNAQCATLLGIAASLKEDGMLDKISGRIRLCAVPAEELLEIEYRDELRRKGIIKYLGGKPEFLRRGYFDGVDLAFMVHTSSSFSAMEGSVGCLAKKVVYKGKSAHAGGSPWNGRNALYAATTGIGAVNSIRETFKESDLIRVHPIITDGGQMVNAIPATTTLESYVRGKTFEGIIDANKKVNRALIGGALSLGANIEIIDIPGYAPLKNDVGMIDMARDAFHYMYPDEQFLFSNRYSTGSTDMGDLSVIMPVVHPYCKGAIGTAHGSDYEIADPECACIKNAKWQLAMINILLGDGANRAKKIISEYTPEFPSKEAYLNYLETLYDSGDRIEYNEDAVAHVRLD